MTTRATPLAPALPAADDSAANPPPGNQAGMASRGWRRSRCWGQALVGLPKLYHWPPVSGVAHAIERAAIVPLLGGALLHPGHGSPVRLTAPPTQASCRPSGCSRWLQEVTVL